MGQADYQRYLPSDSQSVSQCVSRQLSGSHCWSHCESHCEPAHYGPDHHGTVEVGLSHTGTVGSDRPGGQVGASQREMERFDLLFS